MQFVPPWDILSWSFMWENMKILTLKMGSKPTGLEATQQAEALHLWVPTV